MLGPVVFDWKNQAHTKTVYFQQQMTTYYLRDLTNSSTEIETEVAVESVHPGLRVSCAKGTNCCSQVNTYCTLGQKSER